MRLKSFQSYLTCGFQKSTIPNQLHYLHFSQPLVYEPAATAPKKEVWFVVFPHQRLLCTARKRDLSVTKLWLWYWISWIKWGLLPSETRWAPVATCLTKNMLVPQVNQIFANKTHRASGSGWRHAKDSKIFRSSALGPGCVASNSCPFRVASRKETKQNRRLTFLPQSVR